MNDITSTALTDAVKRKRELAAEVDRLRIALAKSEAMNAQWEKTCAELHDARMKLVDELGAGRKRLEAMTLWAHLRMWWAK